MATSESTALAAIRIDAKIGRSTDKKRGTSCGPFSTAGPTRRATTTKTITGTIGEPTLGIVKAPNQEEASDLEMPCVRGVHSIAVRFERRASRVEVPRRPAQVV
jgi:hypothetical protein